MKACALSGVSSFQAGKTESSTFTKYMGIVRQTRRNASRTSVLNDVERTRFAAVMKRIDSEHAYSTSVLDRQTRMFRKSLGDIEKQRLALIKQRDGLNHRHSKGDRFDKKAMDQSNSIADLIKRHKKSRKRGNEGGYSKGVSKKRIYKTRLPSITNESIQETEGEHCDEVPPDEVKDNLPSASPSKPSKRTNGRLTLPVFMKPVGDASGDAMKTSKSSGSSFYTGNELSKRKNSSEVEGSVKPLKLPAINSRDPSEWT